MPATPARILFVDDEAAFLDILRPLFTELSGGSWTLATATSAAVALATLRGAAFDLAVLDLRLPDLDGLQLLQTLNREFPSLQKVFLTGFADQETRAAGLAGGAALFLEKPTTPDGLRGVFATLNELVTWQRKLGERGTLRGATLLDLIKLECKAGNSRLFEVSTSEVAGQIWIQDGAIIHAVSPERRGQSAFTFLMTLPDAGFSLKQFTEPVEHSIDRQWEFLVLEAVQLQEQLAHAARATPPPAEDEPPPAGPSREPRAPEAARSAKVPRRPAPRAKPAPVAPLARLFPAEPNAAGLRIEEVLYCTTKREVLYEDRCWKPDRRLRLAEFVARNAGQLGEQLPLGRLDRLELQSAHGRLVARLRGDRCLIVRSNTAVPPPPARTLALPVSGEAWFESLPAVPGTLALGLVPLGSSPLSCSFATDFAPPVLPKAWQAVVEASEAAQEQDFPAWQLRWVFERAQLCAVRRAGGVVLAAFLRKEAEAVDLAGVERIFTEFSEVALPR
jgi:CheY-like chemotaxis protein